MANIKMIYKMFVYDDGKVVLKPDMNEEIDTSQCSSSIRHIVMMLKYACENTNAGDKVSSKLSEAISMIATNDGITTPSVHAKVTRKLGVTMEQFKNIVDEYFDKKSNILEEILQGACVARTKEADKAAVKNLIDTMKRYIK